MEALDQAMLILGFLCVLCAVGYVGIAFCHFYEELTWDGKAVLLMLLLLVAAALAASCG